MIKKRPLTTLGRIVSIDFYELYSSWNPNEDTYGERKGHKGIFFLVSIPSGAVSILPALPTAKQELEEAQRYLIACELLTVEEKEDWKVFFREMLAIIDRPGDFMFEGPLNDYCLTQRYV
jgi:hypothetical protein